MLGTLINCGAILLGGLMGLVTRRDLSTQRQLFIKVSVGVALAWVGFKIALGALTAGDWRYFGKLFLILMVSMVLGRFAGRLLRIQAALNRTGTFAKDKLASGNRNDGLAAATVLFCAAPLGIVGAIQDGLANQFAPLVIKGVMDGLASLAFARPFGARVLLAALPVAALQAAIGYAARMAEPWLQQNQLLDPIHVVSGFLVVYVSLIVFEVKKVELGDYLPAIAIAPALFYAFR